MSLHLNGIILDSVFVGDIILKGVGDPTILWVDTLQHVPQFYDCATHFKKNGIKEIKGHIIGDDNYMDNQKYGIGWSWENEPFWFQPEISTLSSNGNCVTFDIHSSDSLGTAAHITFSPPFSTIHIINKTTVVSELENTDITIIRDSAKNEFHISGTITPNLSIQNNNCPLLNIHNYRYVTRSVTV